MNIVYRSFYAYRIPTLEKIESGKVWSPGMAATTVMRSTEQEKIRDTLRLEDLKISTPKVCQHIIFNSYFMLQVVVLAYDWIFYQKTNGKFSYWFLKSVKTLKRILKGAFKIYLYIPWSGCFDKNVIN